MGFCHKSLRAIAPLHNRLFEKKTNQEREQNLEEGGKKKMKESKQKGKKH